MTINRVTTTVKQGRSVWLRTGALLLLLSALFLSASRTLAAVPAAGTAIGNAASATYDDGSGTKIATSNTVTTIVAQVASFTLTAAQTKPGAPGTTIYFPHTITNTGNGTDTFNLSATDVTSGTFNFSAIVLYPDANGDGIPDSLTTINSTGALAAGAEFKFVAAGVVPGSATDGQTDTITVTAQGTATTSPAAAQTNLDVVNVSGQAVIDVNKAISAPSGAAGSGPYSITLTYRNNGFATATAVTLGDTLPAGMTYVAGSGRWSVSGATALTDAAAGDPAGITYQSAGNVVTAVVASVSPGVNGTVTFQVNIAAGVAPSILNNTASYSYNNGAANVGPFNSNTASFAVLQTAGVAATDASSTTDADSTTNDIVLVSTAPQGSTVTFDNTIQNTGNGSDSFDITMSGSNFPAGTTFLLFKSDGVSPLVDTSGNGTPDTGPVAAGASYHVFVKAVLPAGTSGVGAFNVTKTARSVLDPTQSNTVIDRLGAITSNSVDLTNNTALPGAPGAGAGPEGSPVTTNTVSPGASTTFTLVVNNTGPSADNYDLSVVGALPSGWTVLFKADGGVGNCSTTGANITNTSSINSGASRVVCAQVNVPAGAAAVPSPGQSIVFRVASPTSGVQDSKLDAVVVSSVRAVSITPNGSGQTAPNNTVVYQHTITNGGNVTEAITFVGAFLSDTQSANGWSSTAFLDNGASPGVLDPGDTQITGASTFSVAPNATQPILVRVFAPSTAATGQIDQTTITVTATNVVGAPVAQTISATDTTTVITGLLQLLKEHALDANCDGTADTGFGTANISSGAIPGVCIRYRITASNAGTAAVNSVVVSDSTPANTVYDNGSRNSTGGACGTGAVDAAAATTVGSISAPACGSAGSVSAAVGTLNPGQSAVITFGVLINNN